MTLIVILLLGLDGLVTGSESRRIASQAQDINEVFVLYCIVVMGWSLLLNAL